jgi:16S rRNA (guanine527-N7)-methyltransferase
MADDPSAVSRETPPVPSAARGVFRDRLALAEQYAERLADDGVVRGLIGPREVPRLWERHLLNCAVLAELVPTGATVADIGSGAGLPGLVLALARPDLSVTLVEPLLRRTTFLDETVRELGLESVEVLRARAEELHGSRTFDVVTSRAVAPLDRLLAWSMPLARTGGVVLAMKGSSAAQEIRDAAATLRRLGAGQPTLHTCGRDVVDPPTTVVRVEATRDPALGWVAAGADRSGRRGSGRSGRRKGPRG